MAEGVVEVFEEIQVEDQHGERALCRLVLLLQHAQKREDPVFQVTVGEVVFLDTGEFDHFADFGRGTGRSTILVAPMSNETISLSISSFFTRSAPRPGVRVTRPLGGMSSVAGYESASGGVSR